MTTASTGSPRLRLQVTMRTTLVGKARPFARTLLPLTMEFARVVAPVLRTHLESQPEEWPFEDRVLGLIAPVFQTDIERFHARESGDLSMMFQPHQIEHLDQGLLEKLVRFAWKESPKAVGELLRAARGE